jgi:undecaprenyl-diphosphatase
MMPAFNGLNSLDYSLLVQIHSATQNSFLDSVMPYVTNLGTVGAVWLLFSIFLISKREYRNVGMMCIAAMLLTTAVGEGLLKHLVQRPRPFVQFPTIELLIPRPSSYSFPSGHTGSSFAAAWILARNLKKAAVPVYALAAVIAFSRLYLMVHFPSDVLGGIIVGTACAACAEILFKKYMNSKEMSRT